MSTSIPLDRIRDNPYQPRQAYGGIEELAATILEMRSVAPDTAGLLQVPPARVAITRYNDHLGRPVWQCLDVESYGGVTACLVQEKDAVVQLAAGHRRLRAFQYLVQEHPADYFAFPVDLRVLDDEEMFRVAMIENSNRADLSPIEEAQAYADAMERWGLTQEQMAKRLGISRSAVANKVRLLRLPDVARAAVADGRLTERHGRLLLSYVDLPPDVFEAVAQEITPVASPSEDAKRAIADLEKRQYNLRIGWSVDLEGAAGAVCCACGAGIVPSAVGRVIDVRPYAGEGKREFLCLSCHRQLKGWEAPTVRESEDVIDGFLRQLGEFLNRARFGLDQPVEGQGVVQPVCEGCVYLRDRIGQKVGGLCLRPACYRRKDELVEAEITREVQDRVEVEYGFRPAVTFGYSGHDLNSRQVADKAAADCRHCLTQKCEHLVLRYDGRDGRHSAYLYPYDDLNVHYVCDNSNRHAACLKRWLGEERLDVYEEQARDAASLAARERVVMAYADRCIEALAVAILAGTPKVWEEIAYKVAGSRAKSRESAARVIARRLLDARYTTGYIDYESDGAEDKAIERLAEATARMGVGVPPQGEDVRAKFGRIRAFILERYPGDLTAEQVSGNLDNLVRLSGQVNGDEELGKEIGDLVEMLVLLEEGYSRPAFSVSQETAPSCVIEELDHPVLAG